jgi:hypothetical protein
MTTPPATAARLVGGLFRDSRNSAGVSILPRSASPIWEPSPRFWRGYDLRLQRQRYAEFIARVRKLAAERGLPPLEALEPEPFSANAPDRLDLSGFGAVIFTAGFRPDYKAWVHWPNAFDDLGFPIHEDGTSTVVEGLYFVGVHFLRKRKSSLLIGVGEDAAIVAGKIATAR